MLIEKFRGLVLIVILLATFFASLQLVSAVYSVGEHFMPPDTDDLQPVCAMKTKTDGYFYRPNMAIELLKIEMLFFNQNITGDQTGATSPYPAVPQYPDGYVNAMDATLIGTYYGGVEGRTPWNYMADINADKCINAKDAVIIGGNFGKSGTYITDLASVTVAFNTGEELSPDSNRSILIPQYATSFTVKRYGVSIGAMIIFIGPASAPIAYSTNFEFTVPNDGDNDVHYYVMTKFYVPSALSGQTFYFIADADQGVEDLKLNAYTKACFGGQVNISLGILGGGYHLLEFEYVDIWLYGWLNFRVETASGQPAWLSRFRIYVPNYSNNACNYTVTTHTWCSMKDDYFLIGYANDSINNVCVDGLVWQDWMWDMGAYGAIYAWGDGFCYPLGNLENNTGLNAYSISFNFTEIWEAGMLDFQYISRTSQSGRIGRPKFYASAEIDNLGTYMTLNNAKIYGGSLWADSPGVSERNVTILTTHNISYNDGDSWFNTILAVEIGNWWATWELGASQPPDVAIPLNFTVVNLTSNLRSGLVLNTLFFWEVSLKDYTIDVYSFQNCRLRVLKRLARDNLMA